MGVKKIIIAGIAAGFVILAISLAVNFLVQILAPYNVLLLGGMREASDPIMLLFFLHYWVISFAMAIVYNFAIHVEHDSEFIRNGLKFGLLMWIVSSIPSAYIVFTSMNYPIGFTMGSVLGSFLYMIGAGITVARVIEKEGYITDLE